MKTRLLIFCLIWFAASGHRHAPRDTDANKATHYIGELLDGGVVCYLNDEGDGAQHGLIVSLVEKSTAWQTENSLVRAFYFEWGDKNTDLMKDSPAKDYVLSLGSGWYVPASTELVWLEENIVAVNEALLAAGGTPITRDYNDEYWSSREEDLNFAETVQFDKSNPEYESIYVNEHENVDIELKEEIKRVRAFRRF